MGDGLGVHAAAGVADREHYVIPRLQRRVLGSIDFVQVDGIGFEDELAAVRHGIAGIDGEVD